MKPSANGGVSDSLGGNGQLGSKVVAEYRWAIVRPQKEVPMPAKVKTTIIVLVAIFLTFAVVQNPERSAAVVHSIWDLLVNTVTGFGRFFTTLAS